MRSRSFHSTLRLGMFITWLIQLLLRRQCRASSIGRFFCTTSSAAMFAFSNGRAFMAIRLRSTIETVSTP